MALRVCPQCPREQPVTNGSAAGKAKKPWQPWGSQFPRTTPRGKPLVTKSTTLLLSLRGLSMHRIALLLRVLPRAVLTWIRACAKEHQEKPEPPGSMIVLERNEMWHSLTKKRHQRWIWHTLDRDTGQRLDGEWGRRDKTTVQKRVERLVQWDVTLYCTDTWATEAAVIPHDQLGQSTATTHDIERNHGRQRHGCGRFKRQAIMVSTSQEMVERTMALCTTFWVNGNHNELLSLCG